MFVVKFNPPRSREAQSSVRAIVALNRVSAINYVLAFSPLYRSYRSMTFLEVFHQMSLFPKLFMQAVLRMKLQLEGHL